MRPPNERMMNSKIGRDVSRDNQNVYGAKSFEEVDCGSVESVLRVGRVAVVYAGAEGVSSSACSSDVSSTNSSSSSFTCAPSTDGI